MKKDFITENDKVYDVIKKYPHLKEILIKMNPVFKKLNNPVLFNSVARITPLKKAAQIGKIYTKQMLLELNEAIGKKEEYLRYIKQQIAKAGLKFPQKSTTGNTGEKPVWIKRAGRFKTFDFTSSDKEPFLEISKFAVSVKPGKGFIVIQSFEPLPLINYLEKLGFEHFSERMESGKFKVYFYKGKGGEGNEQKSSNKQKLSRS